MTERQFYELVARMRVAQKSYEETRATWYHNESKRLEREVDRELEQYKKDEEERGRGVPLPF